MNVENVLLPKLSLSTLALPPSGPTICSMLPLSTPGRNVPAGLPMIWKAAAVGCVTTVLISTAMPCGSTLKV